MRLHLLAVQCVFLLWLASFVPAMGESTGPTPDCTIIPVPKTICLQPGTFALGKRIVSESPGLQPLAQIAAQEIRRLTGKELQVEGDSIQPGDVVLRLDNKFKGEAYGIDIGDTAVVRGGNYAAVAFGTVSLLQSLSQEGEKSVLPRMSVADEPFAPYRGLLIDVARSWHSIATLKQMIELCRWYKIRQLQIHFTDDQSFTFPSTAYPKLATPKRHYTVDELRGLENYARDRGVVIVPELEMPGHADVLVRRLEEVFANRPARGNVICPGREGTYRALDVLIGEMADVFRTTPYIHIGADEVDMNPWKKCRYCRDYMQSHQLDNVDELYRHFIVRMNDIVKKHGKKTIVWEGFAKEGTTDIPRDVTVMVFESMYNIAPDLISQGYSVINAAWQPLYVVNEKNWSPEYIYGWNMYRWENWFEKSKAYNNPITVAPTDKVLGAQVCAWSQPQEVELPSLRQRVPAMSERVWSPDAGRTFADFSKRLNATDTALTRLLEKEHGS